MTSTELAETEDLFHLHTLMSVKTVRSKELRKVEQKMIRLSIFHGNILTGNLFMHGFPIENIVFNKYFQTN
jgi:hypothetical protein